MDVFVPFDAIDPKSRLEPPLTPEERPSFAGAMLDDVLDTVEAAGHTPSVLATAPIDIPASVLVDERPLTRAVNGLLGLTDGPLAVIMADVPLATPAAVERLLDAPGDVVLAPGVGGGTNAVVVRDRAFEVDFHGCSIADHRDNAEAAGLTATTVDSYALGVDVDEPTDLAEVLLHSDGAAADWLERRGFAVVVDEAEVRVGVERRPGD